MRGKSRIWGSPYYARKNEHKCLKCGNALKLITTKRIVQADSEEGRKRNYECEMLVVEDKLDCNNCDFQIDTTTYKLIDKKMTAMERKDFYSENEKSYEYIYDDYIPSAFRKTLYCRNCSIKVRPKYESVDSINQVNSMVKFKSFNKYEYAADSNELRKLYFECPSCNLKLELNEVNENEYLKTTTLLIRIVNLVITIATLLLFAKFCS